MTHPRQEKTAALEIHVSFEVSRMTSEYLAIAYEQIIPIVCRRTGDVTANTQKQSPSIPPASGELSR